MTTVTDNKQVFISKNGNGRTINLQVAAWKTKRGDHIMLSHNVGNIRTCRRLEPGTKAHKMFAELIATYLAE